MLGCMRFKLGGGHRYRPEIPELAPSLSQHGAQIGGIWVFPLDQSNCDSSDAYLLQSEREGKYVKHCRGHEDRGRIFFAFVSACVVGKNPNTPNWSSLADDVNHYTGRYRSSGISFLYLWGWVKLGPTLFFPVIFLQVVVVGVPCRSFFIFFRHA